MVERASVDDGRETNGRWIERDTGRVVMAVVVD